MSSPDEFLLGHIKYLYLIASHHIVLYSAIIIRLHRSTTYVDAAYCYRPRSVVCRSVCIMYVTLVSPAETAAPIERPFELKTWVGPRNHVLDEGPDFTMGRGNFEGGGRCVPL